LEPQKENEIPDAETAVKEKEGAKLGSFLREQRERMNLSHDQIVQKIRLRRTLIEALENEAWERLPPPVFVRGFLKSYARILGLDEKEVMDLYRRAAPLETEALRPLPTRRKSSRALVLVVLLMLALAACIFFFRRAQSSGGDGAMRQSLSGAEPAGPPPRVENKSGKGQEVVGNSSIVAIPDAPKPEVAETPPREAAFSEEVSPAPAAPAPEKETPWMVLKGKVKEKTWVSISVDGKEPGESIFQKGASPEWKAKKGFDVVLGNGAGMDFDLDGRRIENLGKPGEVVRLSLP
jgi:cytoskeleton protein RodZ